MLRRRARRWSRRWRSSSRRRVEGVDALLGAAAIDLELGLARAAPADAAGQPRHRGALADHARQHVAQLGQLDLQLAVGAAGVLGEDVEDQRGAVDDLELGLLGDRVRLRGGEVGVADQQLAVLLERADDDLAQLALAEEGARVGCGRRWVTRSISWMPAVRHSSRSSAIRAGTSSCRRGPPARWPWCRAPRPARRWWRRPAGPRARG